MKSTLSIKLSILGILGLLMIMVSIHTADAYGISSCNLDGKKLQRGSKGTSVKKLQRILAYYNNDEDMDIDGIFGRGTKSLVMSFQEEKDLKIDGIVGVGTRQEMVSWCEEYQATDDSGIFDENKDNNSDTLNKSFEIQFTANKSSVYKFPDGLNVEVYSTNDSRCSKGLTCIWEGEVSTLLRVSGGMVTGVGYKEVRLGTVSGATISEFGYTFNLVSGDKNSVQLRVLSGVDTITPINNYNNNNTNTNTNTNTNSNNSSNSGGSGWVY